MKYLLALILLLAAPAYAQGYDAYGNDHLKGIRGTLNMGQAYQWGKLQNQLAAEAPPERKQIEIINRNPAPNYYGNAPAIDLGYIDAVAKAHKAAEDSKPVEFKDSPFYSYPASEMEK